MSRNIKEIGKELMGKSLNSFHRKTGLTQLEENNKMQDGILDGILSQVDDAYIEKTEQSNVIHLDGSGDGVVVLDSIEGNTMVNLWKGVASLASSWIQGDLTQEITNKILTVCNLTDKKIFFELSTIDGSNGGYSRGIFVEPNSKLKVTVTSNEKKRMTQGRFSDGWLDTEVDKFKKGVLVLEGDYTNKEISHYFEGLQSSFEEQVEEDKYKIEILSNNKNLANPKGVYDSKVSNDHLWNLVSSSNGEYKCQGKSENPNNSNAFALGLNLYNLKPNTTYCVSYKVDGVYANVSYVYKGTNTLWKPSLAIPVSNNIFTTPQDVTEVCLGLYYTNPTGKNITISEIQVEKGNSRTKYVSYKQNKIKLLLDEPLRAIDNIKDRLCIRDNKLMVERNINQIILDNNKTYGSYNSERPAKNGIISYYYQLPKEIRPKEGTNKVICDILPYNTQSVHNRDEVGIASYMHDSQNQNHIRFCLTKNILGITEELQSKPYTTELLQFLRTNPISVVYRLNKPYYEEVLNEYGEPIILEGYENGTIYIDSTIVPTTTVKYTPKMESFKTLKEVNDNNIMLTNDVNDNIIPYMMDVDLMIMEKEMALPSKANIRRIGAKDMTSMQKRTQDMLERLIKGKTLTEKECKTRVVTYLNAGKITDEQADELMLLISEVYA